LGVGVLPHTPNPKTPNPQSPIPIITILNKKKLKRFKLIN